MLNVFKTILEGLWNNILNREVPFDQYKIKVYVPTAFVIMLVVIVKFIGSRRSE